LSVGNSGLHIRDKRPDSIICTTSLELTPDSSQITAKGAEAARGFGEFVQLAGELALQAEGKNFLRGHRCLQITSDNAGFAL
jgi:hypothetical protein